MSKSSEPDRTPDAAENQEMNENPGNGATRPEDNIQQAPYFPNEKWRVPGEYRVVFYSGYTVAEHVAFLGVDFEPMFKYHNGYAAALDDKMFNAVRRDPGVKFIHDNCFGLLETDVGDET